mmetsp:Transcript_36685/g.69043  ORF Transcript_36685/g.69043 Transcript_36685/m.69043 type:complete len:235 (-) Transcript_36685:493-1197(-)
MADIPPPLPVYLRIAEPPATNREDTTNTVQHVHIRFCRNLQGQLAALGSTTVTYRGTLTLSPGCRLPLPAARSCREASMMASASWLPCSAAALRYLRMSPEATSARRYTTTQSLLLARRFSSKRWIASAGLCLASSSRYAASFAASSGLASASALSCFARRARALARVKKLASPTMAAHGPREEDSTAAPPATLVSVDAAPSGLVAGWTFADGAGWGSPAPVFAISLARICNRL